MGTPMRTVASATEPASPEMQRAQESCVAALTSQGMDLNVATTVAEPLAQVGRQVRRNRGDLEATLSLIHISEPTRPY